MTSRLREAALAAALVVGVVLAFHWLLFPRVADPDSFYHVGHARHYAETSLLDTSFPWTAHSAIAEEGADLWWGFHALLVPLSGGDDVAAAVRRSAAALTVVGLLLVALLALRHRLLDAPLWAPLFFVAVPNVLFRYLAVRPEVLSVPLALLLLSALARRRPWAALVAATAITWVHLSMFWLGPGLCAVWVASVMADGGARRSGAESTTRLRTVPALVFAVGAGTALGWLLRPNPLGAARLAWIQIAELLFEKTGDTPLTFAVDLAPLDLPTLWVMAWPLLLPWAAGLAVLAWAAFRDRDALRAVPAGERAHLWASLVLAGGFLGLTVVVARRSLVHWAAFATLSLALVVTHLAPGRRREAVSRALLAAFPLLFAYSLWRNALNVQYVSQPPDAMAEVATWLSTHAEPGDLVFNTHWDTFGPLFAHNRAVRYVGGMDPIFQYARDPELYWEFHHISTDASPAATCPAPVCPEESLRDTHAVLGEDFGARWIVVEPRRNPRLSLYLLNDPRYRLALETPREAVFERLVAAPVTAAETGSDARSSGGPG